MATRLAMTAFNSICQPVWKPPRYRIEQQARRNLVPLHRLHQRSRVMERIGRGDTVWAFARRRTDGAYVIVARYLVSHIGEDPHPDQMSSWRFFESDESGLTPFDPDEQENA